MLASKTVLELLDAFSAPTPTPGGGSAAALAGATSASLLAMVAAMPKTKHNTPEDRAALDAAHLAIMTLRATMIELIDRDAASYDAVVAAYRLPKATDDEKAARKAAVALAMKGATEVPRETARAASALIALARAVAEHGNPNAKSDVSVAMSLAMSALSGGSVNIEANLEGLSDDAYATAVREDIAALMRDAATHLKPAYEALGWRGHTPPNTAKPRA
jgi:formiminotetrahydrofolate cyclodeaminase